MHKPTIVFDAERMKYPHTGIYHYCKHLGLNLLQQQQEHSCSLAYYLPRSASGTFKGAEEIIQGSLHKFRMPLNSYQKLWHINYQGSHYFPFRFKGPIVLTIHDLNFMYENKSTEKRKKYLRQLKTKAERANAIVTISEFVKKDVCANLDMEQSKVKVIYNGCNISTDVDEVAPRQQLKQPFIFSIGAITPKKNFHILPATLKGNDYHAILAGVIQDKEYYEYIVSEAKRLGVNERFHYVGAVSEGEKYWYLHNCVLFVFPSLAEGFGLPVIEAMRFGKPVLLSKATSLPEVGGDVAFYLDSFEVDHISSQAQLAIERSSTETINKSIERSKMFNWEKSAREYWALYDKLCNC